MQNMMKYASTFCLLSLMAGTALAQVQGLTKPVQAYPEITGPQVVHLTPQLVRSPEGRAALEAFRAARAAGKLPRRTAPRARLVGELQSFNVIINLLTSDSQWTPKDFELQASNTVANVWVAVDQMSKVSQGDVDALVEALLNDTPEGSFNVGRGIIANDTEVFGDPPNFDGDGILDVLVYDISEGEGADEDLFVLGFFSPQDINPNAPSGIGNQADILYLDTDPLIVNPGRFGRDQTFAHLTAAHEYQHLIHANYDLTESDFVNEGLSEWAEYMNGYQGRTISYLNTPEEHNVELLATRQDGGTTTSLEDRQRGSLLHNYMGEQLGVLTMGALTRDPNDLEQGYFSTFGEEAMKTIVADFHTANFLNDTGIDPRFGYTRDKLAGVKAVSSKTTDGRTVLETPATTVSLNTGGVQYITWTTVEDFTLNVDAAGDPTLLPFARARLHPRIVLRRADGSVEVQDLELREEPHSFAGDFDAVTLIMAHIDLAGPTTAFTYSAAWSKEATFIVQEVAYDDGTSLNGKFVPLGAGLVQATRFAVPDGATLSKVFVAPYYWSQFDPSITGPKNFELGLWDDDGNGFPGTQIFSTIIEDTQSPSSFSCFTDGTCQATFIPVDLENEQLDNLPDPVYVGISDTGSDVDSLIVAASPYTVENTSFLRVDATRWVPAWDLRFVDDNGTVIDSLTNTTFLIRAEFSIPNTPVANEDVVTLPQQVALAQNYPNPFNPVTTIEFSLARAGDVRLAVYDVLGRRVATLAEGLRPAGRHEVRFDASGRASGLYFYTLETADRKLTRTMLLLK